MYITITNIIRKWPLSILLVFSTVLYLLLLPAAKELERKRNFLSNILSFSFLFSFLSLQCLGVGERSSKAVQQKTDSSKTLDFSSNLSNWWNSKADVNKKRVVGKRRLFYFYFRVEEKVRNFFFFLSQNFELFIVMCS